MRCAKCGAPIDEHAFPGGTVRCDRCGTTVVIAEPTLTAGPYREAMPASHVASHPSPRRDLPPLCPRCTRALDDASADLVCAACGGVFVTHAELAVRIDSARPQPPPAVHPRHASSRPPEPTVRYARCPSCTGIMTRMNFGRSSGIVVDVCREHGTWFDRDELESALRFVRDGGLEATEPPDSSKRVDDERAVRALEAELSLDAMREKRSIERVADIADDLLGLLFGFSTRSVRRSR
jgi:Zn-finger nucleic acid-binding protein